MSESTRQLLNGMIRRSSSRSRQEPVSSKPTEIKQQPLSRPTYSSCRLYDDAFEKKNRMNVLQQKNERVQEEKLKEELQKAFPTKRSGSVSSRRASLGDSSNKENSFAPRISATNTPRSVVVTGRAESVVSQATSVTGRRPSLSDMEVTNRLLDYENSRKAKIERMRLELLSEEERKIQQEKQKAKFGKVKDTKQASLIDLVLKRAPSVGIRAPRIQAISSPSIRS
jgi:hypothetical protein